MDPLVVGALRAQVELARAVSAEGRVGVAVDQARDRDPAVAVDDLEAGVVRADVVGRADGGDAALDDRDRGRLVHEHAAEVVAAQRRAVPGRRDGRRQVGEQVAGVASAARP